MKLLKYISSQIITFFFPSFATTHHLIYILSFAVVFKILFFSCFFSLCWPHLHHGTKISCWAMECKLTSLRSYIYIRQAKHSNKINVEAYVIDFYFIYFLQTDVFHGNLILIGGVAMFFDCFLLKRWFLFSSSRSRNVYIKNMSVLLELSQTQQFV